MWCAAYLLAGFLSEACICFYHRARENNRFILSSVLCSIITIISIMVMSRITYSVITSPSGHFALIYVFIFALGKGLGTFISLTVWDRLFPDKPLLRGS